MTTVLVEKSGPVTTIILNRPEMRNAVDRPTAEKLAQVFRDFDEDATAAVAVLCGAGQHFCSGADLKAIASADPDRANKVRTGSDGPMGPTRMTIGKPVIAAINGYCVAGGLELALWADLRIMEEDATLGVFCRRWGVPLLDGGTVRLPRLIGLSRAMDLILTGRPVDATEAERIGLANRVVPTGTSREAAETFARQLAELPQTCLRHDRLSAIEQHDMNMDGALLNEHEHGLSTLESGEAARGAAKFVDSAGPRGSRDR